jgi:DICT domain-containing protein
MTVSLYQSLTEQRQELRAVNTVPMMNIISHQIERQIISHQIPAVVYSGFQRFSAFIPQMKLYRALGASAKQVYVFGTPDVRLSPIPGVHYVALGEDSPLCKEWFLVVDTSDFWTVLSTQEVPGTDEASGGRKFKGVWSFDMTLVGQAAQLIAAVATVNHAEVPNRNFASQSARIAEVNGNLMARLDGAQIVKRRSWIQTLTTQKAMDAVTELEDIDTLFTTIADLFHNLFGADGALLVRTMPDKTYKIAAKAGNVPHSTIPYSYDQGIIGRALALSIPINVPDVQKITSGRCSYPTCGLSSLHRFLGAMAYTARCALPPKSPKRGQLPMYKLSPR